ncbi:hypothetical protein PAXRUDRAFT_146657, partial [Paxillus rubicundulus Ve08.2h10]
WSDSTQLAQFGHSTTWPIYLFFGNLLKYIHASPALGTSHPVAFILPYIKHFLTKPSRTGSPILGKSFPHSQHLVGHSCMHCVL